MAKFVTIEMLVMVILIIITFQMFLYVLKGKIVNALTCYMLGLLIFNTSPNCDTGESPVSSIEAFTCDYFLDNICVSTERDIHVDKKMLSFALSSTEYWINIFYPGLKLAELAKEKNLSAHFILSYDQDTLFGVYTNNNTMIKVFVDNDITDKQELCQRTYYVMAHELLHFVANKYVKYDYGNDDSHMIPNLFLMWEKKSALRQDRRESYLRTVEGLIYIDINNQCRSYYG